MHTFRAQKLEAPNPPFGEDSLQAAATLKPSGQPCNQMPKKPIQAQNDLNQWLLRQPDWAATKKDVVEGGVDNAIWQQKRPLSLHSDDEITSMSGIDQSRPAPMVDSKSHSK